nr:hypothetical protein [Tanacetum cinerariifolium]
KVEQSVKVVEKEVCIVEVIPTADEEVTTTGVKVRTATITS